MGPRSQNDGAIATFNDRASGFLLIGKMERKCKKEMFKAAIHEFDKIPKNKRQLDRIAFLINNRPRKRLAYRTPLELTKAPGYLLSGIALCSAA